MVLFHGGSIGWGQWYPNVADLADHFTVYAIDLPIACDQAELSKHRAKDLPNSMLVRVLRILRELKLEGCHLVGSSFGGWLAAKVALTDFPTSKLVLVDAVGFTQKMAFADRVMGFYPLARLISQTVLRPKPGNKNLERFLRAVFYDPLSPLPSEFLDYFQASMVRSHNILFISKLAQVFRRLSLSDEVRHISNDSLIIWGSHDKLMPIGECIDALRGIPRHQIQVVRAGHIPSIEASEEFNRLVVKFLKSGD